MDFSISQEQQLIRDAFRGALARESSLDLIRRCAARVSTGQPHDDHLWQQLVRLGMPGLLIAENAGGAGLGLLEAALVAQELGRASAPVPFVATCVLAPLIIAQLAPQDRRARLLAQIASGEMRCSVALSAADDVVSATSGLSGTQRFLLDAGSATHVLIRIGAVFHLIDASASGVTIERETALDPLQGLGRIQLKNVASMPLTAASDAEIDRIIDAGRIIMAAQTIGACEYLLEAAVSYAGQRRQFGRVIGAFQAIKHLCAEMAAALYPAISMAWYAAYVFDHDPERSPLNARLAKTLADDTGRMISRTAIEVHGGMGFTDLSGLHYWYKRAAFNRTMLGSAEQLRQEIAELQGI